MPPALSRCGDEECWRLSEQTHRDWRIRPSQERDGAAPQPKADNGQHRIGSHDIFSARAQHRGTADLSDGPWRMHRSTEALRMRVPGFPAIPNPRILDDPVGRRGAGHDIDEMIARLVPSIGGPGAIVAQLGRTSIDRNGRPRW
jgi:hypothetical protein